MNIGNIPVPIKIIFFFIHIDQSLIYNDDIIIIVQMIIYYLYRRCGWYFVGSFFRSV